MSSTNTRGVLWLLALVALLISGLVTLWMVLHRPEIAEGPCLERRHPKGLTVIECEHSEHRMTDNGDAIWCRCDGGETDGG